MRVNLQCLVDDAADFELPVVNMLKSTLEYEANTSLVAAKLANDIQFMCEAEARKFESRLKGYQHGVPILLFTVWWLVIDIARCTPPNHPYQDRLVKALENLRQSDEAVPEGIPPWSRLPDLSMYLRDRWHPIQDFSENYEEEEELEAWKNLNSFTARLTTSSFSPGMHFPIWQLREALEEPLSDNKNLANASIWIACEWILRCSRYIFDFVHLETLEEHSATAPGSLCNGEVSHWGEFRWNFWKRRFEILAADGKQLDFDASLVKRLFGAVKAMEKVEKRSKATASSSSTH